MFYRTSFTKKYYQNKYIYILKCKIQKKFNNKLKIKKASKEDFEYKTSIQNGEVDVLEDALALPSRAECLDTDGHAHADG